jgi:hypothetical protein
MLDFWDGGHIKAFGTFMARMASKAQVLSCPVTRAIAVLSIEPR